MRIGTILSVPNEYSHYGQILDNYGTSYTVDAGDMPKDANIDDEYAYKVEIWGNDSGIASSLHKE